MSERQIAAILTAILRVQMRSAWVAGDIVDGDVAARTRMAARWAVAMARGGLGATELVDAVDTITGGIPPAWEILLDVDAALALRGAAAIDRREAQSENDSPVPDPRRD